MLLVEAYFTYMDMDDEVTIEADGSEELGGKGGAGDAGAKVAKLKAELEKVKAEKQEYLDGWQRAKADYVNALKRFDEEKKAALAMGRVITVGAFIPVIDSLARAQSAGPVPPPFDAIARQLHEAAKSLGIESFGEIGESFDPNKHEALGQDATTEAKKDDTITAVLERGWKSKDAVIRPAKVRVAHFEG